MKTLLFTNWKNISYVPLFAFFLIVQPIRAMESAIELGGVYEYD
jgi:hypothetical protein